MKPTASKTRDGTWLEPQGKEQRRILKHQQRRAREREAGREIKEET